MAKTHPMRFVLEFLDYVDTVGIYDYFDPEEGAMVTSDDVEELIEMARACVPERITNDEAAQRMRELTPFEREAYIQEDIENVVIDLRDEFAEKMSANGGARGLLAEIAAASDAGDEERLDNLLEVAREFSEKEV